MESTKDKERLQLFKDFTTFCRGNNVLKASCGEMEVELRYETKIINLEEEKTPEDEEKEFDDILFHSVHKG